jgi:hypothetical protein
VPYVGLRVGALENVGDDEGEGDGAGDSVGNVVGGLVDGKSLGAGDGPGDSVGLDVGESSGCCLVTLGGLGEKVSARVRKDPSFSSK